MAMMKCKKCGKDVNSNLEKCPNCGEKIEYSPFKIAIGIVIFVIGISLFAGVIRQYKDNINTTRINSKQISNKSQDKIYNLGTAVTIGDWQITVLGSEDKKVLKNSYGSKTTNNNYIIVKLKIKNLSNEASSLLTSDTEVTDSSYKIYSRSILELYDGKSTYIADYNLEDYVDNEFDLFFSKINPNTTITYNAVFETDELTAKKDFKLKLSNNDKIFLKIK